MPVLKDATGASKFVSITELTSELHPSDFLKDSSEYEKRLAVAKFRCIEVIRYDETPLYGKGLCAELDSVGNSGEELAEYINSIDSRRLKRLRRQRRREKAEGLMPGERRMRSPQPRSKRRSALFSGNDIPSGYFEDHLGTDVHGSELEQFVDSMRLILIQDVLDRMIASHELELVGETWLLKVSVLDEHTKRQPSRRNVKRDDRSFHGRPNRDRGTMAA